MKKFTTAGSTTVTWTENSKPWVVFPVISTIPISKDKYCWNIL